MSTRRSSTTATAPSTPRTRTPTRSTLIAPLSGTNLLDERLTTKAKESNKKISSKRAAPIVIDEDNDDDDDPDAPISPSHSEVTSKALRKVPSSGASSIAGLAASVSRKKKTRAEYDAEVAARLVPLRKDDVSKSSTANKITAPPSAATVKKLAPPKPAAAKSLAKVMESQSKSAAKSKAKAKAKAKHTNSSDDEESENEEDEEEYEKSSASSKSSSSSASGASTSSSSAASPELSSASPARSKKRKATVDKLAPPSKSSTAARSSTAPIQSTPAVPSSTQQTYKVSAVLARSDPELALALSGVGSIWDEDINDPRHINTRITGVYIVQAPPNVPRGYVRERKAEEKGENADNDEDDGDQRAAKRRKSSVSTASASFPPPLLQRSGFVSAYPHESQASITHRSRASEYIWRHIEQQIEHVIHGGEESVWHKIRVWTQSVWTGITYDARTNYVRPMNRAVAPDADTLVGDATLQEYIAHPLPIALVQAGINIEDHPLLMQSLQTHIAQSPTNTTSTPRVMCVMLPSAPTSLLHLIKSMYISLASAYPSPRHRVSTTAASGEVGGLSKRAIDKQGLDGGIQYVIEKLQEWRQEWLDHEDGVEKARKNREKRTKQQKGDDSDVEMDDGEERKTPSKKKRSSAVASSSPPLSDVPRVAVLPSFTYSKLLLLLPSFERFPSLLLSQFLQLLLTTPLLRTLPFTFVFPIASDSSIIESRISKELRERMWFQVFQLPNVSEVMKLCVEKVFKGDIVPYTLPNDTSSLVPPLPFLIDTSTLTYILREFHDRTTSISCMLKVLRYIVLDMCDATYERKEKALAPGYIVAWIRAQKKMRKKLVLVEKGGEEEGAEMDSSMEEGSDPIERWLERLSKHELQIMCELPSITSIPAASSSFSSSSLRRQIQIHLDALSVHRHCFSRAISVLHNIFTSLSLYSNASGLASGINAEIDLWMYLVSYPLFATSSTAISIVPDEHLPASLQTAVSNLKHIDPEKLKKVLLDEATIACQEAKHALNDPRLQASGQSVRSILASSLALWEQQVDAIKTGPSASEIVVASAISKQMGDPRRGLMLKTATDRMNQVANQLARVLTSLKKFTDSMLRPFHRMPLHELMTYQPASVHSLASLFTSNTEAAMSTALMQPEYYLGPPTASNGVAASFSSSSSIDLTIPPPRLTSDRAASSTFSSHPELEEDLVRAFRILHSMNGLQVNVADWYHAFCLAARPIGEERKEEKEKKSEKGAVKRTRGRPSATAATSASASASTSDPLSDSVLLVRFLSCLTTLTNLGYIKSANRRANHVIKLTLQQTM